MRDRRKRLSFPTDDASTGDLGSLSDLPSEDEGKMSHEHPATESLYLRLSLLSQPTVRRVRQCRPQQNVSIYADVCAKCPAHWHAVAVHVALAETAERTCRNLEI